MQHYGRFLLPLILLGLAGGGVGCSDDAETPADASAPDAGSMDAGPTGDAGSGEVLGLGVLQFNLQHNLEDDSCVARDDCMLQIEDETDTDAWLAGLRAESNLAVLHYDRPIPWTVFATPVPDGADRISFYDGLIDEDLQRWLQSYVGHFAAMDRSFLAVSALDGPRTALQQIRLGPDDEHAVAAPCAELGPDTTIEADLSSASGPVHVSFDISSAYFNFVMYLYDKLRPDYVALMVEANLFKASCPATWPSLVALYHRIYDQARAEISEEVPIFLTLSYLPLLGYDASTCYGGPRFVPCDGTPLLEYDEGDAETCFPLDRATLSDLDAGDRLEILALSFYPDKLLMEAPGAGDQVIHIHPAGWDGGDSTCQLRAAYPPLIDPIAQLDRLGWTKPVAFAETGARSCRTAAMLGTDWQQPPGSIERQAFWLDHLLDAAAERELEFLTASFRRDYPPLGNWVVRDGAFDRFTHSAFNTFACMGLTDAMGGPKAGVTDRWQEALR